MKTNLAVPGAEKATIAISEYLEGEKLPGNSADVPVDWTLGPHVPFALRRPVWYDVVPEIGKKILVMLYQYPGDSTLRPRCVLDMGSSDSEFLPLVKRMVALNDLSGAQKTKAMKQVLSDPSEAVRGLAAHYLTSPDMRDPQSRLYVLEQFAPIASDTKRPHDQRMEALSFIKWAYDSFSKDSSSNYQVLSFIANRMADPDPEMRSSAVQYMGPKLVGLAKRGELAKIHFVDRGSVTQFLQRDVARGGDDSSHAKKILELMNGK